MYSRGTWTNDSGRKLNAANLNHIEQAVADAHVGMDTRGVYLDTFAGETDDEKLTAAMSYAASQTYRPTIILGARNHTFTVARTPYHGFSIMGQEGIHNAEKGTGTYQKTRVQCNVGGNNFWLNPTGSDLWNLTVKNIAFVGTSTTSWLNGGSTVLWCMHLHNLSFSSFRTILGNQSTRLLLNLCLIDGWFSANNSYNGAMRIGGSDNALFMGLTNIDSNTAFAAAGSANGQYHLWIDYMAKSVFGPIYMTAEGTDTVSWCGIRVTGHASPWSAYPSSNTGYPNWIAPGARIEGRNKVAASNGALITIDGGGLNISHAWLGYGMKRPSVPGHSPADQGVVQINSGTLVMDGITYDRTEGVAETVPLVYQQGGELHVSNVTRNAMGGAWTGRPRVETAGGTSFLDSTVTEV